MRIRLDRPWMWTFHRMPVWRIHKVGQMIEICLGIIIINISWGDKEYSAPCEYCEVPAQCRDRGCWRSIVRTEISK